MTTQTLTIPGFPRPEIARALSPNGRLHWAPKRNARLHVVDQVTIAAIRGGLRRMRGMTVLHLRYVMPDHRLRDPDNYSTGVTKALIDCLVKGEWLEADDSGHLQLAPVEIVVEKGCRSLEIRLESE